MKKGKFIAGAILTGALALTMASCNNKTNTYQRPEVTSDSLYVKKVDNLDDNFILGMDSSQVISLEKSGVKYYDFDNKETDVFKI